MKPSVSNHDRLVTTPFGLLGNDENALSYALGYTFAKCPRLLQHFLRHIGIGGLWSASLNEVEITLQRHERGGITDIEISLPERLFVVVEAKVGLALPTLNQCLKYLPRFESHKAAKQRLVALVASPAGSLLDGYRAQHDPLIRLLTTFHWTDLIPDCAHMLRAYPPASEEGQWLRAFQQFLEQEYTMRAFTEEVWIVSGSTTPLWPNGMSFYDTHAKRRIYYRINCHAKRPLYMAFRVRGEVTHIQKVLGVKHEIRPVDLVPELKSVPKNWPNEAHTAWMLGEPTPLPRAIPTGDKTMRARQFSCDLDVLLSSSSVREAVQKMKQRKHGE